MEDTDSGDSREIHREDHLTASQVADIFGVHLSSVMRWRHKGSLLPIFETRGLWLYDPAQVREFGEGLREIALAKIPGLKQGEAA